MKHAFGVLLCLSTLAVSANAETFLIKDGKTNAEIIISENPPRMVRLAASELQTYLEKISGGRLPILNVPGEAAVRVYVGKSSYTDRLGVTDEGLRHGAFRIKSGSDHLVLLGEDFDFVPKEPWPRSNGDSARAQEAWEAASGTKSTNPMDRLHKDYNKELGEWRHDRAGSLNAVYAFLRRLGARWYLPGELGEVLPRHSTIVLPSIDHVSRPDFAVRMFKWTSYASGNRDDILWERRLGLNTGVDVWGASPTRSHGMRNVVGNPSLQANHPEYYALRGGQRDIHKNGHGTPCFSSVGLMRETVRYVRSVYSIYDEPMVSIWPTDGLRKCQCEKCEAHDLNALVWRFVDRVARELYRSHPDRLVSTGAYSSYVDPPESIERFPPNLVVYIANRGRPVFALDSSSNPYPEKWPEYRACLDGWLARLAPGRLMRGENNRRTLKAMGVSGDQRLAFPMLHPHAYARDMTALKGHSLGERSEMPRGRNPYTWRAIGADHLNLYVHGRTLWDADLDIEALLEEYYTLFHGPAREEMKAAFEFAYQRVYGPNQAPLDIRIRLLEMLHSALAKTETGENKYRRRIQLILDDLQPLDDLRAERERLANAPVPRFQAPLVMASSRSHQLKDIATGDKPKIKTTFTVQWVNDALRFDIRCQEPDMDNLSVDDNVWGGDSVAILLETPHHSYYQIEINPEGKVFDASREGGRLTTKWTALAEIKTERGSNYWRVIARIPVVTENKGAGDPNHFVVGNRPTTAKPWRFNLGRARVRHRRKTAYAFSPTGSSYHVPEKFARLAVRAKKD